MWSREHTQSFGSLGLAYSHIHSLRVEERDREAKERLGLTPPPPSSPPVPHVGAGYFLQLLKGLMKSGGEVSTYYGLGSLSIQSQSPWHGAR